MYNIIENNILEVYTW